MKDFSDMDKGPWRVFNAKPGTEKEGAAIGIQSDDFTHDVLLRVSGDFKDNEQKYEYCELLAKILNTTL